MPTKPGDNNLGKRDTRTLERHRHLIDPKGRGVRRVEVVIGGGTCRICRRLAFYPRRFVLKRKAEEGWNPIHPIVCNECYETAQC